jgi:hypothetical protein
MDARWRVQPVFHVKQAARRCSLHRAGWLRHTTGQGTHFSPGSFGRRFRVDTRERSRRINAGCSGHALTRGGPHRGITSPLSDAAHVMHTLALPPTERSAEAPKLAASVVRSVRSRAAIRTNDAACPRRIGPIAWIAAPPTSSSVAALRIPRSPARTAPTARRLHRLLRR